MRRRSAALCEVSCHGARTHRVRMGALRESNSEKALARATRTEPLISDPAPSRMEPERRSCGDGAAEVTEPVARPSLTAWAVPASQGPYERDDRAS